MKKLLLGLGTAAAVIAPVASVVACGAKDSVTITFPTTKGPLVEYPTSMDLADDTPEALQNAFKSLQTDETAKMPAELIAFQNEVNQVKSNLYGKTQSELFSILQNILQREVNIAYKYANFKETITVTYKGADPAKSIVTYDTSTLFDGIKDDFNNINADNIGEKMTHFASATAKKMPLMMSAIISQLKSNPSIAKWAAGAGINADDAVFMSTNGVDFTLGDTESDISGKISQLAAAMAGGYGYGF